MRLSPLLLLLLACCVGRVAALSASERWDGWLTSERRARQFSRTTLELEGFDSTCRRDLSEYWSGVVAAHESLSRVVVLDARHNWNGLGDTHERLNFLLRVGRGLGRATFLWLDSEADADAGALPGRAAYQTAERITRPATDSMFDPGAHVVGFGGVRWQWRTAARRAVEQAHPNTPWLFLQYECMHFAGGCLHAQLRHGANGSVVADVKTGSAAETGGLILDALTSGAAAAAPLLRLQLSHQTDLVPEAHLQRVCPSWRGSCDQSCESFANWRPGRSLWDALRPHLRVLDRWAGGAVALTVRTGAADHVGALPGALLAGRPGARGNGSQAAAPVPAGAEAAAALGALFAACPAGTPPLSRSRAAGEAPCVNWAPRNAAQPAAVAFEAPGAAAAAGCGGESAAGGEGLPGLGGGPLGAYVDCAARLARALAAQRNSSEWGVLLFSDAPALKCLLEGGALAAAGHAHVTPSAPGHVQYAPPGGALRRVGLLTLLDWYILGLVDWQLPVLGSAFGRSADVRRKTGPRPLPPASTARAMASGLERWFEAGRENYRGLGVDLSTLQLLLASGPACPVTAAGCERLHDLYAAAAETYGKTLGKKQGFQPSG